jgi:hypothetical protein
VAFIAMKVVLNVGGCPASPRHVHDTLPRSGKTTTVSWCFVLTWAAVVAAVGETADVEIGVVDEVGAAAVVVTVLVQAAAPRSTVRAMT